MRKTVLINKSIDRTYGTVFLSNRFYIPGLQYISCLRHSSVQVASSGGTTDIVAMEFIPLNGTNKNKTIEFIPLQK